MEHILSIDGQPARYLEAGAGWPVVLIHAFPLSGDMWRPQLEAVPKGYRFIAPDLPGFRGPDAPLYRGPLPKTMDDYARHVARVLDALEIDRAIVGGLSMGGYVAFALFRLAPDRFSGLVLADTRAGADSDDGKAGRDRLEQLALDRGAAAVADDMLPKLLATEDATVASDVRRLIEANPSPGLAAALGAMKGRPDSTAQLARMSFPALVIAGEHDTITPVAEAERMQALLPRSMLSIVPRAGHLSNLENPADFSEALASFLTANL